MSRCAYPKCALTFGHEGRHRAYESTGPLPPEGPRPFDVLEYVARQLLNRVADVDNRDEIADIIEEAGRGREAASPALPPDHDHNVHDCAECFDMASEVIRGASPAPLDVERLNQAVARVVGPAMSLTLGRTRTFVDMVAIEYARLTPDRTEPTEAEDR